MKKKILIYLLILFRFELCLANLPVVESNQFQVGRFWVWNYINNTNKNKIYSSEKYKVIKKVNDLVTIVISSKNSHQNKFKKNHKLIVNLNKCHWVYKNKSQRKSWKIKTYYFQNKWISYHNPSTSIFEEKFNCDPHVRNKFIKTTYKTYLHSWFGKIDVFGQVKYGQIEKASWYGNTQESMQGVLITRNFNNGSNDSYYSLLAELGFEK